MRNLLFIIAILVCSFAKAANVNQNIDSLKKELTSKISDVTRLKLYLEISSSYRKINPDSAFEYADKAFKGSNDQNLKTYKADAILAQGVAIFTKGDFNQASKYFKIALKYSESINYSTGIIKSLNGMGNYYYSISKYDSSLVNYERALMLSRRDKNEVEIAKLIGNIAQIYAKKGDYNKALDYYYQAVEFADKKKDMDQIALLEEKIGNVFNDKGEYIEALVHYKNSLKFREKKGDLRGVANAYVSIGNVYYKQDKYIDAIDAQYASLKVNEKLGNKQSMANSFMTIGSIYKDQKEDSAALGFYNKAKKLIEAMGDKAMLSKCLRHMGEIYQTKKKSDIAIGYFNQGLKISEEIGDEIGICESYNILGNFYQQERDFAQAEKFFRLYLEKARLIESQKGIAEAHIGVGDALLEQGKVKDAVLNCREGYSIIVDNGGPKIKQAACECLYKSYSLLGKSDSAYKYIQLFYSFRDSLKSEEISNEITRRDLRHDYEKKKFADSTAIAQRRQVEKLEEAEKDTRQNMYLYLSTGAFIITLIMAIGIFTNFRLKQQSAKIIKKQKEMVEEKNAEIMSSIRYAQRIQNALLTSDEHWDAISHEYFVMLKPKDVVSGDFYWAHYFNDNKAIWVAADCTGHGVPGAFMSMLGIGFLNEIIVEDNVLMPDEILNRLRTKIINALRQKGVQHQQMDGMDLALCLLDKNTNKLHFAGANNPLWIMRNNQLLEFGANKQPVGYLVDEKTEPFTMQEISLEKGDTLYTFTDGYTDQFGGTTGKKYKFKKFRELLKSVQDKPMKKQKEIIEEAFEAWKGNYEQVDDVCIIGVKITK